MTLRNLADFIDSCVRVPAAGVHAYLHPQARDTINFGRFLLDYLSWHLVSMSMAMIVLRATAALWIGMWWVQKFGVSFLYDDEQTRERCGAEGAARHGHSRVCHFERVFAFPL